MSRSRLTAKGVEQLAISNFIMKTELAKISQTRRQSAGRMYLWLAVMIFGAASAITKLVTQIGEQHLIYDIHTPDGRNPIAFCNLLFVGNLCALLLLIPIYGREWNWQALKQLSGKNWLNLISVAILSGALAPALFFLALSKTMINNVILVGRIEPPLVLALSIWLLRERVNPLTIAGAVVSLIGVSVIVFFPGLGGNAPSSQFTIGTGEWMAAAAAVAAAVATIISKVQLAQVSLGIFTIVRLAVGTVVFFSIALSLFGADHFMDVFSPFLWQVMLLYSAVIVVFGQFCWFMGLKKSKASEVSLASTFIPVAGIVAAYLILGEAPTIAQYIGGSIIIAGIAISQIGETPPTSGTPSPPKGSSDKEINISAGFKGI